MSQRQKNLALNTVRMRSEPMPVEELSLDISAVELSSEASGLIDEVDRLIDDFDDSGRYRENRSYVPSDGALLYAALAVVTEQDLPIGRVFCELGSGFGLGVCLAATLGYQAYGLEIDGKLVEASRELARRRGLAATMVHGSYFPEGYSQYEGVAGAELVRPEATWHNSGAFHFSPRFEGMDHDTEEIDVFFVYPWPKEHELMQDLFEDISSEGALLIAYYGEGEICVYRKTLD
jgi:hypothetical protein